MQKKLLKNLKKLLSQYKEEIEFIVLFGSRATDKWTVHSDYDIFVGLNIDDGKRLIDRIYEFSLLAEPEFEIFPYSYLQWQRMFKETHPLMLEVLEYGKVLFDRGSFSKMKEEFLNLRKNKKILPLERGWQIKIS